MIKWHDVSELPLNKELYKKAILLLEGRLQANKLYVLTDYWKVFIKDQDLDLVENVDMKKKLDDGTYAYGSFSRGILFSKVKGWMWEDELVDLYNNDGITLISAPEVEASRNTNTNKE